MRVTPIFSDNVLTITTDVPATIYYTLDGGDIADGYFWTERGDAPLSIHLVSSTIVTFKAVDSRPNMEWNESRTYRTKITVERKEPAVEQFKKKHFFQRLSNAIVDHNFYAGDERWTVPVGSTTYYYAWKNIYPRTVLVRCLHNGMEVEPPKNVEANASVEFPIFPASGNNDIEIQVNETV